ncbi:copper chaperone CopZ [Priestia sp. Y58]|uniref:copper chaperone CopZ n=1 Tax=Priestia TaxID=2800373 RepID=UPI001C8D8D3A|nr:MULTISPECIES: copper chaperone CopZ [Priestia]MBX9987182.1 copper chaperone CopZ [Priestia aryabhattai]MBX9998947.1 copper chaperone CopZ [Priestia aryabhattai]MCZ8495996.1 copper chaperone CopZ [Priestia megaterium]MDG0029948.1 copper chaperone CopZ [Priestia sp. Y58]MDG0059994.1 copper chaperone CopZ [Priestia sp. P5]
MENVTLSVQGMSCGHCVKAVEGGVGELNGVKSVEVSLEDAKVTVAFDPRQVTVEDIKEAIDDQGYDVA